MKNDTGFNTKTKTSKNRGQQQLEIVRPYKLLCWDVTWWWSSPPALACQESGHQQISQFACQILSLCRYQTTSQSCKCCYSLSEATVITWQQTLNKSCLSRCLVGLDLAPSSRPFRCQAVSKFGPQERKIKSSSTAVSLYWDNISAHKPLFFL